MKIDNIEKMFEEMNKDEKNEIEIEAQLRSIITNASSSNFNESMLEIITWTRQIIESEDKQSELYEIDLSEYENYDDDYLND